MPVLLILQIEKDVQKLPHEVRELVKFLFDENISFHILKKLDLVFENSEVNRIMPDHEVGEYAKKNNLTIVTYDEDFFPIQLLQGFPPKIIWLRFGNTTSQFLADLINQKKQEIKAFILDSKVGIYEIY